MKLNSFTFNEKNQSVSFVETIQVKDGVECDVYTFDNDLTKDLGIIRIKPNSKTPLQKVLKGDRTIEGYISGIGKLVIMKRDGSKIEYVVNEKTIKPFEIEVKIEELMQWIADENSDLIAYEICFPPYKDGRYENLPD